MIFRGAAAAPLSFLSGGGGGDDIVSVCLNTLIACGIAGKSRGIFFFLALHRSRPITATVGRRMPWPEIPDFVNNNIIML